MLLSLTLLAAAGTVVVSRITTPLGTALLALLLVLGAFLAAIGRLTQDPLVVRRARSGRRPSRA